MPFKQLTYHVVTDKHLLGWALKRLKIIINSDNPWENPGLVYEHSQHQILVQ